MIYRKILTFMDFDRQTIPLFYFIPIPLYIYNEVCGSLSSGIHDRQHTGVN